MNENHLMSIVSRDFCSQQAFKHASLSCVPLCISWPFLFCIYHWDTAGWFLDVVWSSCFYSAL